MNVLRRILMWPFRPIVSETAATGLVASALTVYFVLGFMKWAVGEINGYLVLAGVSFMLLALPYASIFLLARSSSRSYRDNTGSKAICELIGILGLFSFACIVFPML